MFAASGVVLKVVYSPQARTARPKRLYFGSSMRYFHSSQAEGGGMRHPERFLRISIAASLLAIALPLDPLNPPATSNPFVGTWHAPFQSKTFLTATSTM